MSLISEQLNVASCLECFISSLRTKAAVLGCIQGWCMLFICRRKQKENQEDLLKRVNEETLRQLRHSQDEGNQAGSSGGRQVSEVVAYRSISDMPSIRDLAIQVASQAPSQCTLALLCNSSGISHKSTTTGCVWWCALMQSFECLGRSAGPQRRLSLCICFVSA